MLLRRMSDVEADKFIHVESHNLSFIHFTHPSQPKDESTSLISAHHVTGYQTEC